MKQMLIALLLCPAALSAQDLARQEPQIANPPVSPMVEAIRRNDVQTFKKIREAEKSFTLSLVFEAVKANAVDCLDYLISLIKINPSLLLSTLNKCQDELGYTPLHHAAELSHISCLDKLIKAGADVEVRVKRQDHTTKNVGAKAIHLAQTPEAIKALSAARVSLIEPNYDDLTPLELAVERRQVACVKTIRSLITQNLTEKDPFNAFLAAIRNNDKECMEALLTHECHDRYCHNYLAEYTAIMQAVDLTSEKRFLTDSTKKFLRELRDKTVHQLELDTALLNAAKNGKADLVRDLIRQGAHIETKGPELTSPLHFAVLCPDTSCLKTLIELGADVNALGCYSDGTLLPNIPHGISVSHYCYTPLLSACRAGRFEAVQLLLEAGANFFKEIDNGPGATFHIHDQSIYDWTCRDIVKGENSEEEFFKVFVHSLTKREHPSVKKIFSDFINSLITKQHPSVADVTAALQRIWAKIYVFGIIRSIPSLPLLEIVQKLEESRKDMATIIHYHILNPSVSIFSLLRRDLVRVSPSKALELHSNKAKFLEYLTVFMLNSVQDLAKSLSKKSLELYTSIPCKRTEADQLSVEDKKLLKKLCKEELHRCIYEKLKRSTL